MQPGSSMLAILVLSGSLLCGCGGSGGGASTSTPTQPSAPPAATPTFSATAAQNGASIVSIADTSSAATIYYTLDGSTPTTNSQIYQAPFLVASSLTVKALAVAPGSSNSAVASQAYTPTIASGTLVWSDEFTGGPQTQPDPKVWTYDTGNNGFGNKELENYCAWGSNTAPCTTTNPNAYVGNDGYLHVVAQQPSNGVYTSARLKSQGLFSVMYGRVEARIRVPESQGMWPAFWMLGNNITTVNWPACGELDIMEHIDGSNPPAYVGATPPGYDWVQSSVHGTGLDGGTPYHPSGFSAAAWHTYGMIWSKGQVQFYIDDPSQPYETFTPSNTKGTWPFDQGPQFIILNLAVGGNWPGNPDATTIFPSEMLVDYVRVYTN